MSCWALVAVKSAVRCKQRLACVLGAGERNLLVNLMLDDVVEALHGATEIDGIAIVSPEPRFPEREVTWIADRSNDLNQAVQQAAAELQQHGATDLLVLHPDLPTVRPEEIDELIRAGRRQGLALAPDVLGRGTNAVFTPLPSGFSFRFGPASLERHMAQARAHGIAPAVVSRPGLAFDVDMPGDLSRLVACAGQRYGFIQHFMRSAAWPPLQLGRQSPSMPCSG